MLLIQRHIFIVCADVAAAVPRVDDHGHDPVQMRGARRFDRIVRLALARIIIPHAGQVIRAAILRCAAVLIQDMRPSVLQLIDNNLVAARQNADDRIAGARAGAHGQRRIHHDPVQAGHKRRLRFLRLVRRLVVADPRDVVRAAILRRAAVLIQDMRPAV